jgi:hypothetical protein
MNSRQVLRIRWEKAAAGIAASLLLSVVVVHAQAERIIKGVVTDSTCAALGSHKTMLQPGEDNAQCAISCVKKGAKWVLIGAADGNIYQLDNQKKFRGFAGRNVAITGVLDKAAGSIRVDNVVGALPQKVLDAKSVYIFCDACPRAMAKAKLTAIEELDEWNHFNVVLDPKNADLVFIYSANPYLGDYVTRDGPDKRPVHIETTFMNVVDPQTGENLWGGYEEWGSMLVPKATRALISELRLEIEEQTTKGDLPASLIKRQGH